MNLDRLEMFIRQIGGILAYAILSFLVISIMSGIRRKVGRSSGFSAKWLRSPWFYLVASVIFFGVCYLGWRPLPLTLSPSIRAGLLFCGSLLYFPGFSFVLWGRLALGSNYFVSTGIGAQLFEDHQLVTNGPFAIVRHPMYAGLILASIGSLPIYLTWTTLLFACFSPLITLRARREEMALAAEFGEAWQAYCRRVHAFVPRIRR